MTKLDRMIAELCPNGVQISNLSNVCTVLPSGVDKKINNNERPVKLCNYMDVYNNRYITQELAQNFMNGSVTEREYELFSLKKGQVLLTKDSETADDIGKSTYVTENFDDVVCGYHVAVLTPNKEIIDGKFLNYLFTSAQLQSYFARHANGVSRFGLKIGSIENAPIPIPHIKIQQEIVRILDVFTELRKILQALASLIRALKAK